MNDLTAAQQVAFDILFPVLCGDAPHSMAVLEGYAGSGKLQPLDEPVLTPSGWGRMGDIRPGDQVMAGDGTPATVLQTFAGHSLPIYRVTFSDGSWTECCEDHLWKVQTKRQSQLGSWSVLPLKELLAGINEGSRSTINGNNKGFKYRIPLCGPVQFAEKFLPVDPYLLGYILGDGHSAKKQNSLRITVWSLDLDSLISKIGQSNTRSIRQYESVYHVEIIGSIISAYNSLGLRGLQSKEKRIPAEYLCASIDQRKALLAGLMDSDGSSSRGKASFSTTSPFLAEGVGDLVRSLGGLSSVTWVSRACRKDPTLSYDEAKVTVRLPFNPFLLPRKADLYRGHLSHFHFKKQIVSADYVGLKDGQCLLIDHPDHLYLTRGYTVTHNTYLVAALLKALPEGLRVAVAAPTNKAVRVLHDQLVAHEVPVASVGDEDRWDRRAGALLAGSGCVCRSIHSLLGLRMTDTDDGQQDVVDGGAATLDDYDVVVVDECSMINLWLFRKIVEGRGRAVVLFVGDPAQLPPVEKDGQPKEISPVFARVHCVVRLTEIIRQAADNPIIQLSVRIRDWIEFGEKADAKDLMAVLPPLSESPVAAIVSGPPQQLVDWWLSQHEDEPDSDVRIIAYTNARVQHYNAAIHFALHGDTGSLRFVAGQTVIVHTQCQADRVCHAEAGLYKQDRLITSDELLVLDCQEDPHPFFPEIPANRLRLRDSRGETYRVWVVLDDNDLQRRISACFSRNTQLKAAASRAQNRQDQNELRDQAKAAVAEARALKKSFAPLRCSYAITCHKSQGSTFDCALVDFSNLKTISTPFEFNRALYVAATRSRKYLAMVVT